MLYDGEAIAESDAQGRRIVGDTILVLFNAGATSVTFTLPVRDGNKWDVLADTADPEALGPAATTGTRTLLSRSAVVLKQVPHGAAGQARHGPAAGRANAGLPGATAPTGP